MEKNKHFCKPTEKDDYALKIRYSETQKVWALQISEVITGTNTLMIEIQYCPWCGKKLSK